MAVSAPPANVADQVRSEPDFGDGAVANPEAGDFILTRARYWSSWLVTIAQWLLLRGGIRRYSYWNHVAVFLDREGYIVEAIGTRVIIQHISKYQQTDYSIVHIDASDEMRKKIVQFATSRIGELQIPFAPLRLALAVLTGRPRLFRVDSNYVGSGLVINSLIACQYGLPWEIVKILPARLARFFGVLPPIRLQNDNAARSAAMSLAAALRASRVRVAAGLILSTAVLLGWMLLVVCTGLVLVSSLIGWAHTGSPLAFVQAQPLARQLAAPMTGIPLFALAVALAVAGPKLSVQAWHTAYLRRMRRVEQVEARESSRTLDFLMTVSRWDNDPSVRIEAIRVLGELYYQEGLASLKRALRDDESAVRQAAREVIRQGARM